MEHLKTANMLKVVGFLLLVSIVQSHLATFHHHQENIPSQYIVKLKENTNLDLFTKSFSSIGNGQILQKYESVFRGVAVRLNPKYVNWLRGISGVEYVEEDGVMHAQAVGSWGIDRVDQRSLPLDDSYTAPGNGGSSVNAFIVDTGIRYTHVEFQTNRANFFFDYDSNCGTSCGNDCNGHGTAVAGVVGGSTYGVAPNSNLWSVRVLSCFGSGSISAIVAGLEAIGSSGMKPIVVVISVGGGASQTLDNAVEQLFAAGITVIVAAGNSNANACNFSPGRTPVNLTESERMCEMWNSFVHGLHEQKKVTFQAQAITVASTDMNDMRRSSSNYGSCVDLFAPGGSITSAWHTSDTAVNTLSGSTFSCAHVGGAAALLLGVHPGYSPSEVTGRILGDTTLGTVGNPGSGSPNRLLYVGSI